MSVPPHQILLADFKNADISAEIPYLFSRAGCAIDVYCSRASWLLKSRYKRSWFNADTTSEAAYAHGLIELVRAVNYDWIVLTDDFALRILNDHCTDPIVANTILPLSQLAFRDVVGSKSALSKRATEFNILTPPYVIYESAADCERAIREVPFPLLMKVDRSGGGNGIYRCAGAEDVRSTIATLPPDQLPGLVFQQYIQGENIAVEALLRGETVYAYTCAAITRNVGSEFGVSAVRRYYSHPGLEPLLSTIGSTFGIRGFCSLTFMKHAQTGVHYLIEADMRPHSWFALSRFAGVDFSLAIRNFLSNTLITIHQSVGPADGIEIRHFFRDIRWCISYRHGMELFGWLLNKDGCWRFIPLHDTRLFLETISSIIRTYTYSLPGVKALSRMRTRSPF